MNKNIIKRRYLDLRMGGVTINPIIQASNFTMLAYLTIEKFIPIYIFIPLFIIGVFTAFTASGFLFRKVQMSTDENLKFERQSDLNKVLCEIMKQQKRQSEQMNLPLTSSFIDELNEVERRSLL